MRRNKTKRLLAFLLSSVLLLGNIPAAYATENVNVLPEVKTEIVTAESPANEVITLDAGDDESGQVAYGLTSNPVTGIEIIPEKESYEEGETVHFSINNTSGKEIREVLVTWGNAQTVPVMQSGNNYSFMMPAGEVTITVSLKGEAVLIDATVENAEALFDKEEYESGETVNVVLKPMEGFVLDESCVSIMASGKEVESSIVKNGNELSVSFVLPDTNVVMHVVAKGTYAVTVTTKDIYGNADGDVFSIKVSPDGASIVEGTPVTVNVGYKGALGFTAVVTDSNGAMPYEMTADSVSFVMPASNVSIVIEEMESYDKGDLYDKDTQLGEDIGKQHDVTTKKEFEPDVTLLKAANWDDIEKGLATLTLTEEDTSDWSANPSDYIIILDRTRTMAIDDKCFWSGNDSDIGFTHSVCLNPLHFYYHEGKAAQLVDYQNGIFESGKTSFYIPLEDNIKLWNFHYTRDGKRITPSLSNGCYDRLTQAQDGIKDILRSLDLQNKNVLSGGIKNRVMYWSFSGPTYKNMSLHPDGIWNEVPEFTTDMAAAIKAIKYESYAGTYYNNSFDKVLEELKDKQKDPVYKDIPTKVIFISDGVQSDADRSYTEMVTSKIKATPNTKLYTILIGDKENSAAGKLLKKYATSSEHFAAITANWGNYLKTITAIQKDQYELSAVEKVLTDKINTKYWEVIGEPILEPGNGTATLNSDKTVLTWNIPTGEGKKYICKLKLKLKDEYRYLLSDTMYPTNLDDDNADDDDILKDPTKAGAVLKYKINGGKYNSESRTIGIKTPELKYGTVEFEGEKFWTVAGCSSDSVRISLKRTMPDSTTAVEVNNTTTNVTKQWKYHFNVRQLPDGTTYPLIKYNNAGELITYEVIENIPAFFTQEKTETKTSGNKIITNFYNSPYKIKPLIEKVDAETGSPLSGAEFSVYVWSKKAGEYIPYKGTAAGVSDGTDIVRLTETSKGKYTTSVWLYYTADNQGKFRIIETKAPYGYFGDFESDFITLSDEYKNVYDFAIAGDGSNNGKDVTVSNNDKGTFGNDRVMGEIVFEKYDKEANAGIAQGDATLSGATYGLYAAEDILHADGSGKVVFKKDEKIKVTKTGYNEYEFDKSGSAVIETVQGEKIRITGLELGTYYLKEIKSSEGYLISNAKHMFTLSYENEKISIVRTEGNVFEQVKKQSVNFYKLTADNNADKLDPMTGAGFTIYRVNDLENGKYAEYSDAELVQTAIDDFRNPQTLLYDTYKKYAPATVYVSLENEEGDVRTGRLAKNVSYADGTSYNADGNAYYVAELFSDKDGIVKTPSLPYGRYLVIETSTPDGKTATRPFVINVAGDDNDLLYEGDGLGKALADIKLTMLIDRPIMSLIRIMKKDTYSGKTVLKEGAAYVIRDVSGAWFDYISNEMTSAQKNDYKERFGDLVVQYSQGVYAGSMDDPFVTKLVKTAKDETKNVYIETPMQLPSGTYELVEIAAPEGYIVQGSEGVIAKDRKMEGNHTFYEKEEDGQWEKTPQEATTFVVSSTEALYDEQTMSFITVVKQANEPAIGKISIYVEGEKLIGADKEAEDSDYDFEYGMKPIEGAVFEIHAAEDIYSQEGGVNAELLIKKGELVATLTSDENGQCWTGSEDWEGTDIAKGLPLGKYTVTQKSTENGFYLTEENAIPREITISYAGQNVPVIYRDTAYENPKQDVVIEVIKKDEETKEELPDAVFGLYAGQDICDYKGEVLIKEQELVATAEGSLKDGQIVRARFAPELPLAKYFVKELKAPAGYRLNGTQFDIDATRAGSNVAVIEKSCTVENRKVRLFFEKKDLLSDMPLSGAVFGLFEVLTDEDGKPLTKEEGGFVLAEEPVAAWTSDKDEQTYLYLKDGVYHKLASKDDLPEGYELVTMNGHLVEGLKIGSVYVLKEVQAPHGYVGYEMSDEEVREANRMENKADEDMYFAVPDTDELVSFTVKDQRVVGNIIITKEGEFLTAAQAEEKDDKGLFDTVFDYVFGRIENVSFDIYVKDDILTPDGSGEIATWTDAEGNTVELKAGALVTSIVTDADGIVKAEGLPLGKYFVKEVSTGNKPNFLLCKEIKEFELAYAGQDVPVVNVSGVSDMKGDGIYFVNERQKVNITIDKFRTNSAREKTPVNGAVFGLFALEDIYGYVIDENSNVKENITALIAADTLIEQSSSDKDGKVVFASDLPCGKYCVKEITPADGYLYSDVSFNVDASYTGEEGEKVLNFHLEAENLITKTVFKKTDLITGKQISGASLALIEKESGKEIATWTSDSERKVIIEGLKLSTDEKENIYIFREKKPADGYVTAQDIEFKLIQEKDEAGVYADHATVLIKKGDVFEKMDADAIEMKDDITRIRIDKIDRDFKILLSGAKFELRDTKGNVITSWTSSEKAGHVIERLPVGTYRLVEVERMDGYKNVKPMQIEVKDTAEEQVFVFENVFENEPRLDVEKSTVKKTTLGATFDYKIGVVKNKMAASVDEFTLTDNLPEEVALKTLNTGSYNADVKIRVEYKTNKNTSWRLWKEVNSSGKGTLLNVDALSLGKDEVVTSFRLCFGTVPAYFSCVEAPVYSVTVIKEGDKELVNNISLTGKKGEHTLEDTDVTKTVLEKPKTEDPKEEKPEDPNSPDTQETPRKPGLVKTGDMAVILPFVILMTAGFAGIVAAVVLLIRRRRNS